MKKTTLKEQSNSVMNTKPTGRSSLKPKEAPVK